MAEIPEEIDPNPEIKTYKKVDGNLVIERTHAEPVIHLESHSIKHAQAMIDKLDGVIAAWEAKKVPYQTIIDKYNSLGI